MNELTETVTAHEKPVQIQARQNPDLEKRMWTQSPPPKQEAICNWDLLREVKSVFL